MQKKALPIDHLFLESMAKFLKACATARTTYSWSTVKRSPIGGRPFCNLTCILNKADHYEK